MNPPEFEYLLFIIYLLLFAWVVTRTRFFINTGLSRPQLIIIFLLKVIAGIFYGWMGIYYGGMAEMSDTWSYHYSGLRELQLLQVNPHEYFINLFHNPYPQGMGNFFGSTDSYWNDLKVKVFTKVLSVFDILSFGHYYVNVIFYAFLSLFGCMSFYRVMKEVFPGRKVAVLLSVFFIPSFLYWSSGLHKEGLVFTAIALIIYHIYFADREGRLSWKRGMGVLLGILVLLALRNFILVVLLPAIIGWLLANRWPKYGRTCFVAVYLFFCLLFFGLRYIDPRLDFPGAVVEKQQAFIHIVGNSSIPITQLKPNVISFVTNTPQAITLSTLRPYPTDIRHVLSLAAAVEVVILLLLLVTSLLLPRKGNGGSKNILYFCALFSFSLLLAIGFSVNNLGAIVRYRSIILPLLMVPVVARIDWNRLFSIFSINTKTKLL